MADRTVELAPPAHRTGCLGPVGNVLWLVIAGWSLALSYLAAALVMLIFIITIPFSVQCVKLAAYALWPFGRTVVDEPGVRPMGMLGNLLWFVFAGWWLALVHVLAGLVLCVTIIGIPFGIQCWKMARLALLPFGKRIVPA
ncbi:MAG: YccF domain-containing protein [Acidimicrobiales bacterium]